MGEEKSKHQKGMEEEEDRWTIHSNKRNKWRKKEGEVKAVEKEDGTTKVRRASQDRRRELPSIYIWNLPLGINKKDLWKLFSGVGEVADVFIVYKQSEIRDNRRGFAFVRFFDYRVVMETLKPNKVFTLHGEKLIIRKAVATRNKPRLEQDHCRTTVNRQRSYAQIVKVGMVSTEGKVDTKKGIGENKRRNCHQEWVTRSIVGELKEVDSCERIQSIFCNAGTDCAVKYLGGLKLLVIFPNVRVMEACMEINRSMLESWFEEWYECPENFCCKEQLAWVEIRCIPIRAWNNSFVRTTGNCLGKFAGISRCSAKLRRLDRVRMAVVLEDSAKFPSSLVVEDGKEVFRVKV